MGMDRNTVIGFVLIGVLMMGMFYFNSQGDNARIANDKRIADSIARSKPKVDPKLIEKDSIEAATIKITQSAGAFPVALNDSEKIVTAENDVLSIAFTSKGGQPSAVTLKNYKKYDGSPLILQSGKFNKLSYQVNSANNKKANTSDLNFGSITKTDNADKSTTISMSAKDSTGKEIIHQYTLKPNTYLVDFVIKLKKADELITGSNINVEWQIESPRIEKDIYYEQQQSHICYLKEDKFDFENIGTTGNELKLDKPVEWVAFKQQFFIQALSSKQKFSNADISWKVPDTSKHIVAQTTSNYKLSFTQNAGVADIPLQLLFAPSDYNILKTYNNKMENIVPYGSGIFAFVKYINRYFLLPAFDFIKEHVASMGIVVLLLTLLIRLLTSPILYKSYVSGAKMKALKPEIDKLKAKHGDDQQAFSMDQMKLWKSAGVSPLGGCLPALLQIPIFMSLYYFFQSNISLRGQNFLWAKDLAAYDSIYNLPFNIPFYGDHVSLFTLTATITSLLISVYSMSNMQDNSNPVMKYMPYIFPVMLLGVFNGLPSALTWYYTISNTITLVLQIVIQKYIINHDKILADIEENRKKPVKQSKLQEKIQAMQDAQKKVQDLKNKNAKK
jgi:YidC/Oxa1 family membrane protein insertase